MTYLLPPTFAGTPQRQRMLPSAAVLAFLLGAAPALAQSTVPAARDASADRRGADLGLVLLGGVSQKSDQVVAGAGVTWHGLGLRFLHVDASALAGVGVDFMTLRPSVHALAELRLGAFRLYTLTGVSLFAYRPRGPFAEFCDKAELDCSRVEWGWDLGLGIGRRGLTAEIYLGTGELPLVTVTGKATLFTF